MNTIHLSFYGGEQEVTGSCYFVEAADKKILIDCGLFQGYRFADEKNRKPFPFHAKEIDALIVTHAHIDHIGRIPKLYKEGFRGIIYAMHATANLMGVMLEDAYMLMKKESMYHKEDLLYEESDLKKALQLVHPLEYYEKSNITDAVSFELLNAGHILGSSFVRFEIGKKIIVFTGDVGSSSSVLLPPHDAVNDVNILIVESAYGNRAHKHVGDKSLMLERAIEDIVRMKGVLMIPVFATERTQDILFEINSMLEFRRIPPVPVFLDSPLAIRVTEVFKQHPEFYLDDVKNLLKKHKHLFDFKHLTFTETKEESKKINDAPAPKVILAGSGMMTGGRILHHALRYLSDPSSILLIVGWQAAGSLGRRLLDKAKEVKVRGSLVEVRAETRVIDGYSAHADASELKELIRGTKDSLEKVFVVQGEQASAMSLAQEVKDYFGVWASAPEFGEKYEL